MSFGETSTIFREQLRRARPLALGASVVWLSLAVVIWAERASAQVFPQSGEIQVHSVTTESQELSRVAMGADGGFVVTWNAYASSPQDTDVVFRRFDSAGNPQGLEARVHAVNTLNQVGSRVEVDQAGRFVVAWTGQPTLGRVSYADVFFRPFDGTGNPLENEAQVNVDDEGIQSGAALTFSDAGEFVVVWQNREFSGYDFKISGRKFAADGSPEGGQFRVSPEEGYPISFSAPDITAQQDGFLMVWDRNDPFRNLREIQARYATFDEVPTLGPIRRVDLQSGVVVNAVTTAVSFGFLVVWQGVYDDGGLDTHALRARRLDPQGLPLAQEIEIRASTTAEPEVPRVAATSQGETVVVVWQETGSDGDGMGVFGRALNVRNQSLGDLFPVNVWTTGDQKWSDVAALPSGDFVVTWTSEGQDGSATGVFARRFRFDDSIFTDGFESGDVAGWSSVQP